MHISHEQSMLLHIAMPNAASTSITCEPKTMASKMQIISIQKTDYASD